MKQRQRIFWKTRRLSLHGKGRCLLTYLEQNDSLERWHCCPLWHRKLANKWNAREFAQKHGCRVPELYWAGRDPKKIPFSDLPDNYVVRPVVGHSGRGIYVMCNGINLHDGKRYSEEQIMQAAAANLKPWSRRKLLVESLVQPSKGVFKLPPDYKCYVFGDTVAAICYIDRTGKKLTGMDFTEDWKPLPPIIKTHLVQPLDKPIPPPDCLEEMLIHAKKLGNAYGTFVRLDFYATDEGCVFGEFSATPTTGGGHTDFADGYLEDFWQDYCPDQI